MYFWLYLLCLSYGDGDSHADTDSDFNSHPDSYPHGYSNANTDLCDYSTRSTDRFNCYGWC
jgi:hypothetical protein